MDKSSHECLEETFKILLAEKKFSALLSLLNNEEVKSVVESEALNLVSLVCSAVKENGEIDKDPLYLSSCSCVLLRLVEKGNPKEVLIGLLENADTFKDDEYFQFLLTPLQKVLMSLPGKRGKTLEWLLDMLNAHVLTLPLPENRDMYGKELLLLDLDPAVQRTDVVLSSYLNFLEPFVEEVSIVSLKKKKLHYSDRIVSQRVILQKCLLQLLEYPLLYHDLEFTSDRKMSSLQALCLKLVSYLKKMCKDFFLLYRPWTTSICLEPASIDYLIQNRLRDAPFLSLANLSYLMFAEKLAADYRPHVYTHVFLFEMHVPIISLVFTERENLVTFKGLQLCAAFIKNISECELPSPNSNCDQMVTLSKCLLNIAVYCTVKQYRSLSVSLFTDYVKKFKYKERYRHLMCTFASSTHSGVHGLLIRMYKDFLHNELKERKQVKYFVGRNLHSFMRVALCLKDEAKTDILEGFDRIVSSLNFLRFLILCDPKEENLTGFWSQVNVLMNDYLEPLHRGIDFSKAHYILEAKGIQENKKKDNSILNTTVTVNGELLPNLPPDYKAVVIEKALLSLDMVESILSRVKDLLR